MFNYNKALKLAAKGSDKKFKKELKKLKKEINREIKYKCSIGLHNAHIFLNECLFIKEEGVINSAIEKLKKKGYTVVYKKPDFISISWGEDGKGMKKKTGDFTIREIAKICKANQPYCKKGCPLYVTKIDCLKFYILEDSDLDVEVDDND